MARGSRGRRRGAAGQLEAWLGGAPAGPVPGLHGWACKLKLRRSTGGGLGQGHGTGAHGSPHSLTSSVKEVQPRLPSFSTATLTMAAAICKARTKSVYSR